METNKTYYDGLRAKVIVVPRPEGKRPRFDWEIRDSGGDLMAGGEEFRLEHAVTVAREAVNAIRTWSIFSRGAVIPSNDGRRWLTFVNTEHGAVNFDVPSRDSQRNLAKLTKAVKKGKVKP